MVLHHRFRRGIISYLTELQTQHSITNSIISSTRKRNKKLIEYLSKTCHLVELDHTTPIPVTNMYKTPETLGRDRLAAVIGAYKEHNTACLVIDAGTCMTYDFVDREGRYHGGNIAPGIHMRIEAMHHFTQKLPSVSMEKNKNLLGKTTEEALQNGAVYGTILEIEAFIERIRKKHSRINIILTGGDAEFLGKNLKRKIFVDQHLVLRGLNEILLHNASNK